MNIVDRLPKCYKSEIENELSNGIEEIRIRIGQQIELLPSKKRIGLPVTAEKMDEVFNLLTDYSSFVYEEQLRDGYFTIEGGYRIGVAGRVNDRGGIDINSINIRIANEYRECSEELIARISNGESIYNTLLVSGPGVGKTTYLRDCVRILSEKFKVGVVDERSEIGAAASGIPQNDLGPSCDVMDSCAKARGMIMLLRSMSPQIICVDEIANQNDYKAICEIMNCGVKFIGTVHAADISELQEKRYIWKLIEKRIIKRLVFLKKNSSGQREFEVIKCSSL